MSPMPPRSRDADGLPLRDDVVGLPPISVDREARTVTVLHTTIALRSEPDAQDGRVPSLDRFRHFAVDARTADVLEKLATAVRLGEPCLLEGETSTSKTSSIEYLAAIVGAPVVRLNLSGQTDTSELIGKFVPNDGQLQVSFDSLLHEAPTLGEGTREILRRAKGAGRGLTLLESQKIANAEGLTVPEWRWQDGVVVGAMTKGSWLILDELNLAEPSVLERLNPVIERHPSLTVTENGGTRIAAGGDVELHAGFRIFATMNPAEYAGRSALSPAYKDRWTAYKYVSTPTEPEYTQMLALLVHGEHPRFTIDGVAFGGERGAPMFPRLSAVEGLRTMLPKLAKLHAAVEGMARRRDIGRDARERYVFTRRTLIELFTFLEQMSVVDRRTGAPRTVEDSPKQLVLRAIRYFYLDRLASDVDRQKVDDLLDAIGISERQFRHDFAPPVPPAPPPLASAATPARPQLVENLQGGTILLSGRTELGAYRVGRMLTLRPGAPPKLARDLGTATRLEVIGITSDGFVVVQIDGGKCLKGRPEQVETLFDFVG